MLAAALRLLALLLALLLAASGTVHADGEVRGLFFYTAGCEYCTAVEEEVLPGIQSAFPLELEHLEVGDPANYERLAAYQRRFGVPESDVPVIVFENAILQGEEEIRFELIGAVLDLLSRGGSQGPAPVEAGPPPGSALSDKPPVGVVYFHRSGCGKCDRTRFALDALASRYPLDLRIYNADEAESQILHERYDRVYGVAEEQRLTAPAVYVGDVALVADQVGRDALEAAVAAAAGAPPPWDRLTASGAEEAAAGILERYRGFRPVAVTLAGLLDGVNPCAFATLLFLLSYLAHTGRSRGQILAVGLCFTAAVFLTYLATGLGLLTFVRSLSSFRALSRFVYLGGALLALGLAIANLYDFVLCLRGRTRDTTLQLPLFLKRRIHTSIRTRLGVGMAATAAFGTGAVVSLLELACTGQVYLPTLMYVAQAPGAQFGAVCYLVLYNLAFILPLVAVFGVTYLGVGSRQLEGILRRKMAWVKLGLALLFLGLGGAMFGSV